MLGVCTLDMHFVYILPVGKVMLLMDEFFEMPLVGDIN
ncbi:hypothetical protein Gotur_031744 [Gossypium turneri]